MTATTANATFFDQAAGRTRYGRALLDSTYTRFGEDETQQFRTVFTADGYQHRMPLAALTVLDESVPMPTARPVLAYVVTEAYETRRGYETADWYDVLMVQPGTYPLKWVTLSYHEVGPGHPDAYYGTAAVDAILTHTHTVSRVPGYSKANDEYPNTPVTHHITTYTYECKAGPFWHGELVLVEPPAGEVFPPAGVEHEQPTVPSSACRCPGC